MFDSPSTVAEWGLSLPLQPHLLLPLPKQLSLEHQLTIVESLFDGTYDYLSNLLI